MFTPPSLESIFLILCGVILLTGILYWFWSHLQLTQKKVQLLENVVFELRGLMTAGPGVPPAPVPSNPSPYTDLEDDDWEGDATSDVKEVSMVSTPLESVLEPSVLKLSVLEPSVLEPSVLEPSGPVKTGGAPIEGDGLLLPEGTVASATEDAAPLPSYEEVQRSREEAEDGFRSFFVAPATQPASSSSKSTGDALETMTLKDLRRLADERGIKGAAEMRKKDLLPLLRSGTTFVERTLDLTVSEITEVVEETSAN